MEERNFNVIMICNYCHIVKISLYLCLEMVFRTHNHKQHFMCVATYSNMIAQLTLCYVYMPTCLIKETTLCIIWIKSH